MLKKIIMSVLLLVLIACVAASAAQKNDKAKPAKKSVLILRDSSAMEISVARILQDTLTKLGYTVKEVGIADAGWEKASSYKISIIFNAVNAGEQVDQRIQKYMNSKGTSKSKIYLFTVYGKVYNQKDEKTDATTQATQELHPDLVAEHILKSIKP